MAKEIAARYALIENGEVVNVLLASPEAIERMGLTSKVEPIDDTQALGMGDTFDARTKEFTPRVLPDVPETKTTAARLAEVEAELKARLTAVEGDVDTIKRAR